MAKTPDLYTDSLVIIYDSANNYITRTSITAHDKREMIIEVSGNLEHIHTGTRLNLLIIHSNGVSEYGGVLQRGQRGTLEITLFGERKRESRHSSRLPLNAPAVIKTLVVNSVEEKLPAAQQVIVENISSTGILIRSPRVRFVAGSVLQIEFTMNEVDAILYGRVIREQRNKDNSFNYGCQLVFS